MICGTLNQSACAHSQLTYSCSVYCSIAIRAANNTAVVTLQNFNAKILKQWLGLFQQFTYDDYREKMLLCYLKRYFRLAPLVYFSICGIFGEVYMIQANFYPLCVFVPMLDFQTCSIQKHTVTRNGMVWHFNILFFWRNKLTFCPISCWHGKAFAAIL